MAKSKPVPTTHVIVVDCGVAHAAGPEEATHSTSRHCRDFLLTMRRTAHRLAWTPAIAEEWHRHRSGFARKWLVSMFAHKLVENVPAEVNSSLRTALTKSNPAKNARAAMLKDAHLLEAAITSEKRIASLDDTVRTLFAVASKSFKPIQGICWVNPDTEHDSVVEWLATGALLEASRQFAAHRTTDKKS